MALLTAAEAADLVAEIFNAQPPSAVVFYRLNEATGAYDALPAQNTVRTQSFGRGTKNTSGASSPAVSGDSLPLHWIMAPDADVAVGDWFELDGHKGGRVIRVRFDNVLGVKLVDGDLPTGAA